MAKCIACGAEISDGQELCEQCASSQTGTSALEASKIDDFLMSISEDFSLSDKELNEFDMDNIKDIDLSDFGFDGMDINGIDMPVLEESSDIGMDMPFSEESSDAELDIPLKESSDETDMAFNQEEDLDNMVGRLLDDLDDFEKEPVLVEANTESDGEMEDLLSLLSTDMEVEGSGTGTSRAVDNENDLFSMDDLLAMEEDNNFYDSNIVSQDEEDVMSLDFKETHEESLENDLMGIMKEEAEKDKTQQQGLLTKLFGNIHDAKSKRAHEKLLSDEEKKALKKKEKEEKKAAKKAMKEDPAYKAEQEAKKKAKEEKKAQVKALKEAKKKEKEELKKQRQAEMEAEEKEDPGRINRVGAAIVFVCLGAFAASVILGSNRFSYNQSVAKAKEYFGNREYTEAYNEVRGVEPKGDDVETYDKIITVMYVNKQLNSYNNYYAMQMYPEALDSLLKGLQKYDEYITAGEQLGVANDLDYVRGQIITELQNVFSINEKQAYSIIDSFTQEEYSQKVIAAVSQ